MESIKRKSKKKAYTKIKKENISFIDKMREKFLTVVDLHLIIPKKERLTLAWKNIVYFKSIENKKGCKTISKDKKYILDNVSGIAKPGRLVVSLI